MAPLSKIKGKYRYQIILKSCNFNKIHILAQQGINLLKTSSSLDGVNVTIDVDPVNLLYKIKNFYFLFLASFFF